MESVHVPVDDDVTLHVAHCGEGPDVVVLSGGPGCVHYLADATLAPQGFRCWFPDPRGVGQSTGGAHDMACAVADLEAIREHVGVERWLVLGHSWGSDLGVRYALTHPDSARALAGMAGHGLQRDREWSVTYHAGLALEDPIPIDYNPETHAGLWASFKEWIHEPELWRSLADSPVAATFVAAGSDIRPHWPLQQLAALMPRGDFELVPGVGHDFWSTAPDVWRNTVTRICQELSAP